MKVEVALTQALVPAPLGNDVHAVIIDVVRFTTCVAAALAAGCDGVRPVGRVDEARSIASWDEALLGGERGGLAPEGFDFGNSPEEFRPSSCAGRRLVMTTTNGSRAVAAVAGAGRVLAGALVNAEATARALVDGGAENVLLVCAGTEGRVAADDVAAAGCVAGSLALMAAAEPEDGARTAIALFDAWKSDLRGLLRRSASGRKLARVGLEKDLEFCARVDTVPVVAELDDDLVFRLPRHSG